MLKHVWGWLAALLFVGLLAAPIASADPYTDNLVGKFQATHVVVDPAAKPPLTNGPALNAQILQGHRPIYIAAVAPGQTGITTPDTLYTTWLKARGRFEGVFVVMDTKGYHVRGFNLPQSVADSINPIIAQSIAAHHNDPAGTLSTFVGKMSQVSPAPAPTQAAPAQRSWTWLWITLGVIGGIIILALLIWGVNTFLRSRSAKRAEQEKIHDSIIGVEASADDLAAAVLKGDADVSTEQSKVSLSLGDAKKAYRERDYATARSHLAVANKYISAASTKLKPASQFKASATTGLPAEPVERRQGTVRAVNPETGRKVTINNYNYRTSQSNGYSNYYGGGYCNGMYFYPGYYPYAFWGTGWGWSPVDVLLTEELLHDRWGGASSSPAFDSTYDSAEVAGWNNDNNNAGTTDVGFDGSDASTADSSESDYSYSGASDTSDSSSSYDSGYDSGSSSSSSDSSYSYTPSSSSYDSGSSSSSYDYSSSSSSYDSGSSSSYDSGSSGGFDSGGW